MIGVSALLLVAMAGCSSSGGSRDGATSVAGGTVESIPVVTNGLDQLAAGSTFEMPDETANPAGYQVAATGDPWGLVLDGGELDCLSKIPAGVEVFDDQGLLQGDAEACVTDAHAEAFKVWHAAEADLADADDTQMACVESWLRDATGAGTVTLAGYSQTLLSCEVEVPTATT